MSDEQKGEGQVIWEFLEEGTKSKNYAGLVAGTNLLSKRLYLYQVQAVDARDVGTVVDRAFTGNGVVGPAVQEIGLTTAQRARSAMGWQKYQ